MVTRVWRVLLLALAFGVVAALFKGIGPGLRSAVGNLSAPWLLVAFLPGTKALSIPRGAAIGLSATLAALVGFYLSVTMLGHLGGHGFLGDLVVEFEGNRIYFAGGLVTGPILGAIGGWCGTRHKRTAFVVAGCLMVGEPVVVALVQGHQLLPTPLYMSWAVDDWTAYLAELAAGLVILAVTFIRWRAEGSLRSVRRG